MRCPRCKSEKNIVTIGNLVYCRNCLAFGRVEIFNYTPLKLEVKPQGKVSYHLDYTLSEDQTRISQQIITAIKNKQHVMIQAVCGSGKTEIVYPIILEMLSLNKHVCFALPRKDLVVELYERFVSQFSGVEITYVYGTHKDKLYAPLVICTTHQLYRYPGFFDLLIIDEADAFPFYGNEVLMQVSFSSCKGQCILMSATLNAPPKNGPFVHLTLDKRYHKTPLDEPKIYYVIYLFLYVTLRRFIQEKLPVLIYVPTKSEGKRLLKLLRRKWNRGMYVDSSESKLKEIIDDFKLSKLDYIVTTTILERGITIENVQVIVFKANHHVFDRRTLIQICGRVGRKINHPSGNIVFLTHSITPAIKECLKYIRQKNASYAKNTSGMKEI